MPLAAFNSTIQMNLFGTFNVIRLAVEHMVKNSPDADGEKTVRSVRQITVLPKAAMRP